MWCVRSFILRRILLSVPRLIPLWGFGIILFWKKNLPKVRISLPLLAFKSSVSRCLKDMKEVLIGFVSIPLRISLPLRRMIAKSSSGSTRMKSRGSIQHCPDTRTTYHVWCLIRRLASWSATLKTAPPKYGTSRQRHNWVFTGDKATGTGSLTSQKTATWLQRVTTMDSRYSR